MTGNMPTARELRDILIYERDTGKLFWKHREDRRKEWNSRFAGSEAFTATMVNGYKKGAINNKSYYAHRVIWVMVFGFIPEGLEIDHHNRDRTDNRISNLRLTSRSFNNANRPSHKDVTSSFVGVCWNKRNQKWVSQIGKDYKTYLLGKFTDEVEAAKAYDAAAVDMYGNFALLNFPINGE